MNKQVRPHSPEGTRLRGPDADGNFEIVIPSESEPGVEHTLSVDYTGEAHNCSCRGYRRYQEYVASLLTPAPQAARRLCWHFEAAADLLAYHLDPPPADPGGARGCRPCWHCPTRPYCAEHGCRYDFAASPADPGGVRCEACDEPLAPGESGTCRECRTAFAHFEGYLDHAPADPGGAVGEPPELAGPTPPAQGAARRPLQDHLDLLYGA